MAMNFGRTLIHQISSRRFASSTGGNLGSSTAGSAGGSQFVRSYKRINKLMDGYLPWICLNISLTGSWLFLYKSADGWVRNMIKEPDEALRKMMEKKGVNREFCEAKIAHIKQKMGSGQLWSMRGSSCKYTKDGCRNSLKTHEKIRMLAARETICQGS